MFQDKLVEHLLAKLNTNTRGITFRGGYLLQTHGESFQFTTWTNYYTGVVTEYVPCMFDATSTPKNIPNRQIYDWTINLTLALTGDSEESQTLVDQREALDWFRTELTNNPTATVTSNTVTYNIITSATDIQLIQDVAVVDGKKRIVVNMTIYVQSGIDIWFGNQIAYSLKLASDPVENYEALSVLSSTDAKSKTLDSAQVIGTPATVSVGIDATYIFKGVVLYKNTTLLNTVLSDILGGETVNNQYTLKISYPNISPAVKTVILSSGAINSTLGELTTITTEFVEQ